jgi:hypothetical protein
MDDDAMNAGVDLVGRTGAKEFQVGYVHDDKPWDEAGWYAHAQYAGTRIIVEDYKSPVEAVEALARRLLTGARCKGCGGLIALSDTGAFAYHSATTIDGATFTSADAAKLPQCRWRRFGDRWEMGCKGRPGAAPARPRKPKKRKGKGKGGKRR